MQSSKITAMRRGRFYVFEVESIDAALNDLRARGIVFLHDQPAENDFARYAAFSDPFGNVHEIFERK